MENEEKITPQTEETPSCDENTRRQEPTTRETPVDLDAQNAALKAENEALKKEREEQNDKYLRIVAEYDNYRKRTAKEKGESYSNGVSKAVLEILTIIDTLEIALSAPCSDENYKKGIEMTLKKAESALANLNVTAVDAVGETFDPTLHNRIMQEEIPGTEPGIVVKQFQKGYKLGEKVIRHRTVSVSC